MKNLGLWGGRANMHREPGREKKISTRGEVGGKRTGSEALH